MTRQHLISKLLCSLVFSFNIIAYCIKSLLSNIFLHLLLLLSHLTGNVKDKTQEITIKNFPDILKRCLAEQHVIKAHCQKPLSLVQLRSKILFLYFTSGKSWQKSFQQKNGTRVFHTHI